MSRSAVESLPIETLLPDLTQALASVMSVVLQAPPGTGKTTRVPLALLGAAWLGGQRIIMLEPRRLAARSAARYMAHLLGEAVGQTVGYRTRLDTQVSAATRIEVVTEGILTRLLQSDPELAGYGAVIFDEFHERSLQADLGLALVRQSQQVLRPALRLLVMSATLDAAPLALLLGEAPILRCEGRTFPVSVRYLPAGRTPWLDHLGRVILQLLASDDGSMLVFLPGVGEIRRLQAWLQERLPTEVVLAPLYGQLDAVEQDRAIAPAPAAQRKIVLSTAVAETSLTIEGIGIVVDSGQERGPVFDPVSGITRLVTTRVSAASAEQRRGRAGRLGPGLCVRLWSEEEQQRLLPFSAPEILQSDLAGTVLELAAWGVRDPAELAWLDLPPAAVWAQGQALLQQLEALAVDGSLTVHGRAMQALGLRPRLAHMLLRARALGHGHLGAEVAALLSERDLLPRDEGADIHARLALVRGEREATGVDRGRLRLVREAQRRLLRREDRPREESADTVGMLLALAYPDRIAQRRSGQSSRFLLSNGRGAVLREDDPLATQAYLVAADLDGEAREARIFLAAPLSRAAVEQVLADLVLTADMLAWEESSQSVLARRQRKLGALVLEDKPLPEADPAAVAALLLAKLREAGLAVLPWTEPLQQWRARVQLLHGLEPDVWPDVSEAALLASLADWAAPYLDGVSRFAQLANFPLREALTGLLDWPLQQRLDEELPLRLTVPSGSSVSIDYTAAHGPVLAVKLQEMFGLQQSPLLARGRVPLTIHLLSPAQRPVAVTQDLASFWRNAYADVRKDLRGRYPKHPWPEDPLTAPAQRGTKRSGV